MLPLATTQRAEFFRRARICWRQSRHRLQRVLERVDVRWVLSIGVALAVILMPKILWAETAAGDGGAVGASIKAKFDSWLSIGIIVAWGVAGFGLIRAGIKFFQGDPEARSIAWSWVFGALCVYLLFDIIKTAQGG